jgi:hypothetical protein
MGTPAPDRPVKAALRHLLHHEVLPALEQLVDDLPDALTDAPQAAGAAEPGALPAGGGLRLEEGAVGAGGGLPERTAAGLGGRRGALAVGAGGGLLPAGHPDPGLVPPLRARPRGRGGGLRRGQRRGQGLGGGPQGGAVGGARGGGRGGRACGGGPGAGPDEAGGAAGVGEYLENNRSRVDYPRYRELGLPVGSGPVEAPCKTLGGARCKLAGMRNWTYAGAEGVLRLRAALPEGSYARLGQQRLRPAA